MSKVRSVRASAIWRSLIALVAALALVATTATPVGAQNGQTDEERLEAEEQALLGVITNAQQAMEEFEVCLLYTSPSPRDQRGSRMPSSA